MWIYIMLLFVVLCFMVSGYVTLKALRHGSHSFTCNYTNACLYLVSVHQMAPPRLRLRTSNCTLLLIYVPRKDERLSRPGWLTYSGRFTRQLQVERRTGKVRRSETNVLPTVPRNQP